MGGWVPEICIKGHMGGIWGVWVIPKVYQNYATAVPYGEDTYKHYSTKMAVRTTSPPQWVRIQFSYCWSQKKSALLKMNIFGLKMAV